MCLLCPERTANLNERPLVCWRPFVQRGLGLSVRVTCKESQLESHNWRDALDRNQVSMFMLSAGVIDITGFVAFVLTIDLLFGYLQDQTPLVS